MISGFFRVLFFSILAIVGGWGGVVLLGSSGTSVLVEEGRRLQAAFPSERSPVPHASSRLGIPKPELGVFLPGLEYGSVMADSVTVIRSRTRVAADFLPIFFLVLASGWLFGSILRERIRFGLGYASPLVSFASKRTAEAALVYFILWSFTPLGLPFWSLYATLPPIFFGALGYLANLPIRL